MSPGRLVVGYPGGPGIYSAIGGSQRMDLITLDGVTFSTRFFLASIFSLTYVPEPSSTPLLAVASLCLLLSGARRLSRQGHCV